MVKTYEDPVYGMQVTPASAEGESEYKGHTYYFCSTEHKVAFDSNPERYIQREKVPF